MTNKDQTPVEWFFDKIKSHFEHDGDLFEALTFTYAIAKEKERNAKREMIQDFANWNNQQYATTIRVYPMVEITDLDVIRYLRLTSLHQENDKK